MDSVAAVRRDLSSQVTTERVKVKMKFSRCALSLVNAYSQHVPAPKHNERFFIKINEGN